MEGDVEADVMIRAIMAKGVCLAGKEAKKGINKKGSPPVEATQIHG